MTASSSRSAPVPSKFSYRQELGGGGERPLFIRRSVSRNAWPITLSISMATVKGADRCEPVARPFPSEPAPSFPSTLTHPPPTPRPPTGPAAQILMTTLTSDPSVGNYNICRHDKAGCRYGPGHSTSLPPRSCLGRSWWGHVGGWEGGRGKGGGGALCEVRKGGCGGARGWGGRRPHNTDRHVDSKHKHGKTNGSRPPL